MDLLAKIQQLIDLLMHLPETMDNLRQSADTIAFYGKIALIAAVFVALIYVFRMPIKFVIDTLRWREMRNIDDRESESEEIVAVVEIAKAKKGHQEPITVAELTQVAENDYGQVVLALRKGRKKHKL